MAEGRPAVLLITTDQLRRDAVGNGPAATPNLDRLAATGTSYERAYTASPWCLPSRSSLITGRYPRNHGAYSNFRDCRLSPSVPNLYSTMRGHGYHVGHIGKCHYAPVPYAETKPDRTLPYDAFRDYYLSLGIDQLLLQDDKQVSVWYYDDYAEELDAAGYLSAYRDAVWDRSARKVFTFPGPASWHPDSWVGRKAAEWISAYARPEPMFCWVSFSGPHFPFDPPQEFIDRIDPDAVGEPVVDPSEWDVPNRLHHRSFHGPPGSRAEGGGSQDRGPDYWQRLRRNYFANVALLDEQIGAVIAAAEERFGDDLVVIFTADHGEMLGNHGFWGKDACAYEDVLRVPLFVRGPGVGSGRSDRLTSLVDLYPTILGAVGGEVGTVDGQPLDDAGHDYVFAEGEGFHVVTDGRHKLMTAHRDGTIYTEMYDTEADPGEMTNVAGIPEYASEQRELQAVSVNAMIDTALP